MGFYWAFLSAALIVCLRVGCTEASNVLLLNPLGSKSHNIFYMGIAEALVDRGYQVTLASKHRMGWRHVNFTEVTIQGPSPCDLAVNLFENHRIKPVMDLMTHAPAMCSKGLSHGSAQDLKKGKFDLIFLSLFVSDCYLSLVHHHQVPFVYMSPAGLVNTLNDLVGNVNFPSFIPHILQPTELPLTFAQRAASTLFDIYGYYMFKHVGLKNTESICREKRLCPPDMPDFVDFRANVSLTFVNNLATLDLPQRPYMPNIIHAGGVQCRPGLPLPQDLEDFIEGSGDAGFIFFSLGSIFKSADMKQDQIQMFLRVFGSLDQRVIWKWDDEYIEGMPSNLKLGKWLPQQDIIAHPKIRLFITHGGLLSTQEATYHGCPVIGMPVFADQHSNMANAQVEGWARNLHWNQFTEEDLRNTIMDVLQDDKMKEIASRRSLLMKDQPMQPKEVIGFWTDYVLRHSGAAHLRSPITKMSPFVLYNMDVWFCIAAVLGGTLFLMSYVLWKCLRFLFYGKSKTHKQKQKKH